MKKNIALTIQYDGNRYHGWQRQENAVTVQQIIEEAIRSVTGETVSVNGCGRTDAGVHALYYVANFFTASHIPVDRIPYALNHHLPPDICCTGAKQASDDFHARFSVVAKRYIYKIDNSLFGNVFSKNYSWHYKYPLDFDKMSAAVHLFKGEHDFKGFCAAGFTAKTTVRTIFEIGLQKADEQITMDVTGNGFLYNMVRIIMGTLVYVGCGKMSYDDVARAIDCADRTVAGITAPPQGLYMAGVTYKGNEK